MSQRFRLLACALLLCLSPLPSTAAERIATVIVDSYMPYSFVNAHGEPDGFSVDLVRAVAHEMGLEITIGVDTWAGAVTSLREGRIDLLPMMAYSPERDREFDFSVAHTIAHDAYFTRSGGPRVAGPADLAGLTAAVLKGDLAHNFLVKSPELKLARIVTGDSIGEVLRLLADGAAEVALMPKIVGLHEIAARGHTNLARDPAVLDSYSRPFSFAVREGNRDLLEKLSQGLLIIKENGSYRRIYHRWFGTLDPPAVAAATVRRYSAAALGVALVTGILTLLWVRSLRRQVAARTRDLSAEIETRLQAEAESRERFHALFEGSHHAAGVFREGVHLFANPAYLELFGFPPGADLAGLSILDLVAPPHRATIADRMRVRAREEPQPAFYETRGLRTDGAEFPLEVRTSIFREGEASHTLAFMRDISEEVQAKEALYRLNVRLVLATHAARMGVWDWDISRNELVWDDLMYELYGVRREDFAGAYEAWLVGVHPDDRAATDEASRQAVLGEREYDTEFRIVRPDGAVRVIKAQGVVIRDEAGAAVRMIGVNIDISEIKYLEAQLRHAQKMEAIGQLAGGVAHDFNNILNVILGYGELLRRMLVQDEPAQSHLHEIISAGRRAADLTAGLLSYSRKQLLDLQPLGLNAAIEQVARLLRRVIGEKIELRLDLAPAEMTIRADRSHIEQVIMNIATNARDAMPGGGTLTIATFLSQGGPESPPGSAARNGRFAGIRITDTGTGMEEGVRARVFDPFFTTKDVDKGTGLGLSICHGIIGQHEGGIQVRSALGEGTTFEILLPLAEPPAAAAAPVGSAGPAPADAPEGRETLLVVEDDPHVRKLISLVLSEAGYRVLEAGDGDEALRVFHEHPGDIRLVVLDVIMPMRNGSEVLLALQSIRPRLAAVFVSGYSADLLDESLLEQPAVAFLRKPVHPQSLLEQVRGLLDREPVSG